MIVTLIFIVLLLSLFVAHCRNFVSHVVSSHLTKGGNHHVKNQYILDIGCGSCCLNKQLRKRHEYHKVTSLDIVDAGKCDKPYIFDGKQIPFDDAAFDIGICAFVLHHTPHQRELLRELARTCNKIIIIEDTPVNERDWAYAMKHARSDWGRCEQCFHRQEDWISLFKELRLADHTLTELQNISRWSCPFARTPLYYPMPKSVFVLDIIPNCRSRTSCERHP